MKSYRNRIYLEGVARFSPYADGVDFTDVSETDFHISIKDLVRLYEGTKFSLEERGVNWVRFCNELFGDKNEHP